mmetsp:Transcript_31967/g.80168  ORF Transcript_31967/g.80168 Transcript_31967/m.80168 type:complete len:439 (-) Transcript_31967:79-1395(-)|eukprot:CAMPEP_0177630314 /NCGR_PEP_ID=MMETSP0447-20121125/1144_1 /TAXON_ID=0 /ORGANISM="Stygamoeba regulata, Strain BSH-02190019" /LENGTH=438 /DNA_ID=CAMNT_0019131711 /DNA_START=73 /DNA_END=1389 /DNA_ORIENTATION=-
MSSATAVNWAVSAAVLATAGGIGALFPSLSLPIGAFSVITVIAWLWRRAHGGYICKEGLSNLKYYKYHGEDHSIMAKLFLKKFWVWFTFNIIPDWVAPNLITATGFSLIITSYSLLYYYDPSLSVPMPSWVYLFWAVSIFLYQLLDNCDGTQARRTGSSSALGELFDHGCDSLFVTFSGMTLINTIGASPWLSYIMISIVGVVPFWTSHWEEYHTGCLILGTVGNPTEAQLILIAAQIATFFFTPSIWQVDLAALFSEYTGIVLPSFVYLPLNWFLVSLTAFTACTLLYENFTVVYKWCKNNGKSYLSALYLLTPIVLHVVGFTAWYYFSPSDILGNHLFAAQSLYGVLFAYMISGMVIDRITKMPYNPINVWNLVPYMGLASAFLLPVGDEVYVMYVMIAFLALAYTDKVVVVIQQLADELKIKVFRIPYGAAKKIN